MGEAILSAIIDKGLSTPQDISVSDISDARCQYLEQKYGVNVTSNNLQAANKGDVVLLAIKPQSLDEVMPGLSGLDVCRLLRRDKETQGIPIIMFTALGSEVDLMLAQGEKADGYVLKPFTRRLLLEKVDRCLRGEGRG